MDICPLKISEEDPLKICPIVDAVGREEFEPCSNMLPHVDGEVLDDEVVIILSSGSVGEPKVFEPYTGVHLPGVPGDVGGRSEALWERRFLDATTKGLWPQAIRLGLRSFGRPPCLGYVSPHSSMVRLGPAPPALTATRWTSSSCRAWCRLLMMLRAS